MDVRPVLTDADMAPELLAPLRGTRFPMPKAR
jgi:hypothetical protein